jgi:AmmeMemoRadiSam system protein B
MPRLTLTWETLSNGASRFSTKIPTLIAANMPSRLSCHSCKSVPIALGIHPFEILQSLGESIAEVIAAQAEPVLIIASSDMNHYESDRVTRNKDRLALDRILTLDPRGLFEVANRQDISMCGLGPTVTMLTSAGRLGATAAELTQYATSGDVSGDREMVVGYAGVIVQ